MLARRQRRSPLFLHRAVRGARAPPPPPPSPPDLRPVVRYVCGHRAIPWTEDVTRLRCLWCAGRACVRFPDPLALLEHLRACHSRFRYACAAAGAAAGPIVVVELKLLTGTAGLLAARVDKFDAWDMEAVYVNAARYPTYNGQVGPSLWKTTRFITKFVPANGYGGPWPAPVVHGNSSRHQQFPVRRARRGISDAPGKDVNVAGGSPSANGNGVGTGGGGKFMLGGDDIIGAGAARTLNAYTEHRLAALVNGGGALSDEALDNFVAIVRGVKPGATIGAVGAGARPLPSRAAAAATTDASVAQVPAPTRPTRAVAGAILPRPVTAPTRAKQALGLRGAAEPAASGVSVALGRRSLLRAAVANGKRGSGGEEDAGEKSGAGTIGAAVAAVISAPAAAIAAAKAGNTSTSCGAAAANGKRKGKKKAVPQRRKGRGKKDEDNKPGVPAFSSVAEGVAQGILYRSVIQSELTAEEFDEGADSDGELVVDEDWRLELNDEQLSEYLDTSALEKMYMNMWNQFVEREVYVFSDRRTLAAAVGFARRYGAALHALRLEVIFVRHLGELNRLGLVDACGMYAAVRALMSAKEAARRGEESVDELLGQFAFFARVVRQEEQRVAAEGGKAGRA
jgi:VEFS-Box of polycomb protein